ncbi:type II toxin-antitoxin system VapC family toxin [Brevundimonas sp. TWP2-3-4b1]|uniref:type II toxin-antitoxin system VapC family toxin n=1 Tax=Brevundimonas sp. TWP2-3-4b1 TaxID=2804580 RepID=UPI003CE6A84A
MIVVDTSVALKWVLDEPDSDHAREAMDRLLVAPDVWRVEAANGLRRAVRTGELPPQEAPRLLKVLDRAPVRDLPTPPLVPAGLELALSLGHPMYDCLFLALAIEQDCKMLTADDAFLNVVRTATPNLAGGLLRLADFAR